MEQNIPPFLQASQFLWIPVSYPVKQTPSEKKDYSKILSFWKWSLLIKKEKSDSVSPFGIVSFPLRHVLYAQTIFHRQYSLRYFSWSSYKLHQNVIITARR